MNDQKILLGYEMGTGNPVEAKLHHLFISGVTQHAGKTTGLEAFINRAGMRALIFKTGRGEIGFQNAKAQLPFFRERTDWRFLEGLISVHLREKSKIYRSELMQVSRGASSLSEVWKRIQKRLKGAKGWDLKIFTELDQYFSEFMPTLGQVEFAKTLDLGDGLNVVDLVGRPVALQQMVIASSLEYIMEHLSNVIVVVPEAWQMIPRERPSPVRLAAENITRQGMKISNFLWLDSQQLTGLDMEILRNIDIWLFGRQTLDLEKERAANAIPGKVATADDIHGLTIGQFYVVQYGEKVQKIYVQPAWLSSEEAHDVAIGRLSIDSPGFATKKPKVVLVGTPWHPGELSVTAFPDALPAPPRIEPLSTDKAFQQTVERQLQTFREELSKSAKWLSEQIEKMEKRNTTVLPGIQVPLEVEIADQGVNFQIKNTAPKVIEMTTETQNGKVLYVMLQDLENKGVGITEALISGALQEHGWPNSHGAVGPALLQLMGKGLVVKNNTKPQTYRTPGRVKIEVIKE